MARSEDSGGDPLRVLRSSVDETAAPSASDGAAASEQQESARPATPRLAFATAPGSSVPGLGLVAGIPCGILRGALSLTANVIESSGGRQRIASAVAC